MTDKQLSNWVLAQALRDAAYSTKTGAIGVFAHVRELFAQQPESAAHQYIKQVVAKDMEKVYKALGRVQPSHSDADYPACSGNPLSCPENEGHGCCNIQQPGAARGERPIKVLGQNGEPYPTTLVGATFEQPARDSEANELLRDLGLIPERFRTEAGFINHYKVRAALLHPADYAGLYLTKPPQPADDEAVGEIIANYETDAGTETVASITKPVPVGAKLYLRPTRGVEADEAMAEKFIAHLDESSGVYLEGSGLNATNVIAAWKAALSGVQR